MILSDPWKRLVKRFTQLYALLVSIMRKHVYISLLVGVLLITLVGSVFAIAGKETRHESPPKKSASTLAATNSTDEKPSSQPSASTAEQAANPSTSQKSTAASSKPKTQSPAPAPASSQKVLKISPSSFSGKPGDSFAISIQTSDGRTVNMPMLSSSGGKASLNFGASPAKPAWNGQVMTNKVTAPGTYTLEVAAQASKTEFYRGTITITIVPQPTMNISIKSLGYDEDDDSLGYEVTIFRSYGFAEQVTDVTISATEAGLDCDADMPDSNTINLICFHASGDRPTNGTLSVTVKTPTVTRSGTAPYSLPPL